MIDTGKDSVGQIALDLVVNKNDFEKQMTGIRGLAKKAGAALAGAFAIKKLVDFSKSCIELGSDLAQWRKRLASEKRLLMICPQR